MALFRERRKGALLGLICGAVAIVAAGVTLAIMLPSWAMSDKVIDLGTVRKPLFLIGTLIGVVLGAFAMWPAHDATDDKDEKVRKLGWYGFFAGAAGCMMCIAWGVFYMAFKP